jgi:hypothetical protein
MDFDLKVLPLALVRIKYRKTGILSRILAIPNNRRQNAVANAVIVWYTPFESGRERRAPHPAACRGVSE